MTSIPFHITPCEAQTSRAFVDMVKEQGKLKGRIKAGLCDLPTPLPFATLSRGTQVLFVMLPSLFGGLPSLHRRLRPDSFWQLQLVRRRRFGSCRPWSWFLSFAVKLKNLCGMIGPRRGRHNKTQSVGKAGE